MKDGCEILARVVGKSVEEYLQENLNADREREPEGWVVSQWDLDNKKFFYELEEGARKRSEIILQ